MRAYVVDIAEEVFGAAERRHRWPFLVGDDGKPLEVDAWWPTYRIAFVIADGGGDGDVWRIASASLSVRCIRVLVAAAGDLPFDDTGELVRDPVRVRAALLGAGFPGSRPMFELLTDSHDVTWSTLATTDALAEGDAWHEDDDGEGPPDGPWYGDAPPEAVWPSTGERGPAWPGQEREPDEEPWLPEWRYEQHDDYPWRDDTGEDDEVRAWDDASRIDLGWRSRPVALAALGAVALTRRLLAEDALDGRDATTVLVLTTLAVPEDDAATQERAGARGVAARLGLGERTVGGALDALVDEGLVEASDPMDSPAYVLTAAGPATVTGWLSRIAPLFSGWPVSPREVDDAQ